MLEVVWTFLLGAAVGSFLNVLTSRYSEKSGFKKALRGRSYCDVCKRTLRWYELIPVVSFIALGGRCRTCKHRIPVSYFIVELLAGLVAVLVPLKIGFTFFAAIWVFAFWVLLLISVIDLRLKIIPDIPVVLVGTLGLASLVYRSVFLRADPFLPLTGADFLGHYSILRFWSTPLANHLLAMGAGLVLFGTVFLLTRGRAMGLGDVKLATAIGLLLMWPDIIVALITPFLIGSLVGSPMVWAKKMSFKSSFPFGPFIAFGVLLTFFFGYDIVDVYFRLFGLV